MIYVNDFEYAATVITMVVLILFCTRRSKGAKSESYFLIALISVLITSVSDIISSYTIPFPENYPTWFLYFSAGLYTAAAPSSIYLLTLYIDSLTKIPELRTPVKRIVKVLIAYEFITWITTYWTHFKIYFDENLVYRHGPLFSTCYIFGGVCAAISIYMMIRGRAKYSTYQRTLLVWFVFTMIAGNVIQFFLPNVLLAGFVSSIFIIFLFIAFENPAYYFYRGTRCQNSDGFYRIMKEYRKNPKMSYCLIFGKIHGYEKASQTLTGTERGNFIRFVADTISNYFPKKSYLLSHDKFVIIVEDPSKDLSAEKAIENKIAEFFKSGINISTKVLDLPVFTYIIPEEYKFISDDMLDSIFDMLYSLPADNDQDISEKINNTIQKTQRMRQVQSAIDKAIQNESFKVYYQPIKDVKSGKFESSEALVRLIDDEYGFIPPDEFIPISEENGRIIEVGDIVLKKVCSFISSNDINSLGIKYIEVNLSPVQCQSPDMADRLSKIMHQYGVDPALINFEITETAEADMNSSSTTMTNILELHKRGHSFSVDDFGSGFASMDHLFSLPISLVKVDRSILWKAMEDENAMVVLKSTLGMVRELNMDILVEGVENQEMVDVLISNGCDYMQGFFYSKPVPENEYVDFLKDNN